MQINTPFPAKPAWALFLAIALLQPLVHSRAAAPAARPGANIVFLVSNPKDTNSYESARTIPPFAEMLKKDHGYQTTVLVAEFPESKSRFPNFEAVAKADLLVIFCRRLGLPPEQLMTIKNHINAGKPVVAIKTANHGFAVRGEFVPGYFPWYEFVADVLGAENRGYATSATKGTAARVVARDHPVVRGLPATWQSQNNVYLTTPLLDRRATVLLEAPAEGRVEPIAWVRMAGESRVFYTCMGHPTDFDDPQPHFRTLLLNGIRWALGEN
jgi:Trehalose utilisation